MQKGFASSPNIRMQVFTERQKDEINNAVLEVLESVGVHVHSSRALEKLKKGGAHVDGNHVRIPVAMVERAVRSAPSRIVLSDRDGKRVIFLQDQNFYFGTAPTSIYTIDPENGERRMPVLADTARASRVTDALENIDFQMDFGSITDVPPALMDVYTFKAMLENSTKPIIHWAYNVENAKRIISMGEMIRGSLSSLQENPFFAIYTEPVTPLVHEFNALDITMTMAEFNLPCVYTPAPQAGVTSPSTMAGTVVIAVAESLSGLVVHQLVREGAPFVMGGVATIMDMATTQITYGSPEFNILEAGLSEMASYYKIPMFSTAGCSDSKCCDTQLASEIAQNILMAALSGGNLIHDCGFIESAMATSLQALAICDELIGKVKRMMRGIPVDDNALALDVIRAVGPGGIFLGEMHTLENFKSETWFPALHDRRRYEEWVSQGSTTMEERAAVKVQDILNNHKVCALPADIQKGLDSIVSGL